MLQINFSPFPNLKSERLLFRQLVVSDIEEVKLLRGNPETMKFIPRPLITTDEQALAHIAIIDKNLTTNDAINWAIALQSKPDEMIGIIGHYRIKPEHFRAEIGYMFRQEFHGNGYATEAIREITKYGFEIMNLHSIEAVIDPENYASERVLQKNGFVKEAHILENEYYDGKFLDTVIYSILKRNFK
jgi:[ribosomal protein S5]-alanine N-acetyltransferase